MSSFSERAAYETFARQTEDLPLFLQPWYLDTVAGDAWAASVVEKGGRPVAVLPYVKSQKGPWLYLDTPVLCKFLGPWMDPAFRHQRQYQKLAKTLIEGLPEYACFRQTFHYAIDNWLPFHWKGFRQTTRYSYRLHGIQDLEATFSCFSTDYRNNKIPRAKEVVRVEEGTIEQVYQLAEASYQRQGARIPVSLNELLTYEKSMQARQSGQAFIALDNEGQLHSGLYLLWDQDSAYTLMAGDDPSLRSSGSGILLVWEAIQWASQELGVDTFDFLGSMQSGIARVRRNFGAVPEPYFFLEHYRSRWAWGIERIIKGLR